MDAIYGGEIWEAEGIEALRRLVPAETLDGRRVLAIAAGRFEAVDYFRAAGARTTVVAALDPIDPAELVYAGVALALVVPELRPTLLRWLDARTVPGGRLVLVTFDFPPMPTSAPYPIALDTLVAALGDSFALTATESTTSTDHPLARKWGLPAVVEHTLLLTKSRVRKPLMNTRALAPLAVLTLAAIRPALAQDAKTPSIIKTSMTFTVTRFLRHWPEGRKEPIYGKWSWVPRGDFKLKGPIAGGSQIVLTVAKPDGSPWLSLPLETPEIPAGEWAEIKMPTLDERKAVTAPGLYPITIVLKNELQGSKTTLFSGKLDVRALPATMVMDTKKVAVSDFYIDHDWTLPLGYLDTNDATDQEAPWVDIHLFFRGKVQAERLAGYIFKDGQQVASTKVSAEGAVYPTQWVAYPPSGDDEPSWRRVIFQFTKLRWFRDEAHRSANNYDTQIFLDKSPGTYELKVLRDGKLIRTASFTIGADGKLVENAFTRHLNSRFKFIPVKIVPGTEPLSNLATYSAKAYYFNPIPGYTAP